MPPNDRTRTLSSTLLQLALMLFLIMSLGKKVMLQEKYLWTEITLMFIGPNIKGKFLSFSQNFEKIFLAISSAIAIQEYEHVLNLRSLGKYNRYEKPQSTTYLCVTYLLT